MNKLFLVATLAGLTGSSIVGTQVDAADADWRQISGFANQAWDRGDVVSACRLAIHAAHRINVEQTGTKYELTYMRDYVAKYCSAVQ